MSRLSFYLLLVLPFVFVFSFFVSRTPGHYYQVDSPVWYPIRVLVVVLFLVGIYLLRWRRAFADPWSPLRFLIGVAAGGGVLYLTAIIVQGKDPIYGSLLAYAFVSGLASSSSKTVTRAITSGIVFFLFQVVVDSVAHGWWSYVE